LVLNLPIPKNERPSWHGWLIGYIETIMH